jgi:hypothetical protein
VVVVTLTEIRGDAEARADAWRTISIPWEHPNRLPPVDPVDALIDRVLANVAIRASRRITEATRSAPVAKVYVRQRIAVEAADVMVRVRLAFRIVIAKTHSICRIALLHT